MSIELDGIRGSMFSASPTMILLINFIISGFSTEKISFFSSFVPFLIFSFIPLSLFFQGS